MRPWAALVGRVGGQRLEGHGHPGVEEELLDEDAVARPYPQAPLDEVLALEGQAGAELDLGRADLLVLLEGDVAADHVVEEDAQRPHGGGVPVVAAAADPLGRGVHAGS